jgi:two-component system, NtrC family, sensor kinase
MPHSDFADKKTLTSLLDGIDVGVIFVDEKSNLTFVNKAGEQIRNISSEESLGTSVLECHHPKVQNKVKTDLKSFLNGDYASRHKVIKTKGKYFDNTYNVVKDNEGNFLGVALLSQDITEKKFLENELKMTNAKLEQKVKERTQEIKDAYEKLRVAEQQLMQSEKMAAIGQFVSGVAHEINNPLDGIQNCIRAVISEPKDKNQTKTFLPLALDGLYKIEILVKQLLEYAKPKPNETQNCCLCQILKESLLLIGFRLKEKKIKLTANLEEECSGIHVEAHYLGQVFVNLILNAIDAMEYGGHLKLETKHEESEIIVSIKDNGHGIPKEIMSKIFDPFFTTKQKENGTGLGLYLSYNIISAHGGKIFVNSDINIGTEFVIKIPLVPNVVPKVNDNILLEQI